MWFKASAPGSLMLLGEHAVLHGHAALVAAVKQRVTVRLRPRQDQQIEIISDRFGSYRTSLQHLEPVRPFDFVLACLKRQRSFLNQGCEISIHSEFSAELGLGSSAAVTVASLAVLNAWLRFLPPAVGAPLVGAQDVAEVERAPTRGAPTALALIAEARSLIQEVQGLGSGADAAASVLGGVVAYSPSPLRAEKFDLRLPLTVIYSGYKTPTVEVVKQVQENFSSQPKQFESLCQLIGWCVTEGTKALREQDWPRLGKVMNAQQELLQNLGVSTPLLNELIAALRAETGILGAKISGSGLGDCVLGLGVANLGVLEQKHSAIQQLDIKTSSTGLKVENHEQDTALSPPCHPVGAPLQNDKEGERDDRHECAGSEDFL